jgi:hypothetical protein
MKTGTLAGIFALFGLGITFSFKPTLFGIQTGDIQNNIQINIGNQNPPQTSSNNKVNEPTSPFEAEYRYDCREAKSKESCKMLAEELAKEKVLSQLCSQIKSQTNIKSGDQMKVEKQLERKTSGQLQGITVLKEGFEGNDYVYRIQAHDARHLCDYLT